MPIKKFMLVSILSGVLLITGLLESGNSVTPENKSISFSIFDKNEKAFPVASAPKLPDVSGYTIEAVRKKIPSSSSVRVSVKKTETLPYSFLGRSGLRKSAKRTNQRSVIIVHSGRLTLKGLYKAINNPDFLEQKGEKYLLKVPLLIQEKASLVISGKETTALLLSRGKGSFIMNFGTLFIVETRVSGWDESKQDYAFFKNLNDFRPMIASLNGSETYIAGSTITHLGYENESSYGLTYKTQPKLRAKRPDLHRPTGWVVHSHFEDMFYGFYSYEADDVVIVGNTYANNIVYGIDPHDRSSGLIIAFNETYGTKEKHGIIISRGVNKSYIFNNYSHHNNGTGLMIDRSSSSNVVAYNVSSHNGADGLTFFESPNNISWKNRLISNGKNGIRLRNSWNILSYDDEASSNGEYGIFVYSKDISTDKTRDIKKDPFAQKAGITLVKTRLHSNKKGSFSFVDAEYGAFFGLKFSWPFSKTLNGMFKEYQEPFLTALRENKKIVFEVKSNFSK